LELCIWPDAIWRWIRQRKGIKFCANLGKIATETLTKIRRVFGEESIALFKADGVSEKGDEQNQEHDHHFL
jgi:hypothetical protein